MLILWVVMGVAVGVAGWNLRGNKSEAGTKGEQIQGCAQLSWWWLHHHQHWLPGPLCHSQTGSTYPCILESSAGAERQAIYPPALPLLSLFGGSPFSNPHSGFVAQPLQQLQGGQSLWSHSLLWELQQQGTLKCVHQKQQHPGLSRPCEVCKWTSGQLWLQIWGPQCRRGLADLEESISRTADIAIKFLHGHKFSVISLFPI